MGHEGHADGAAGGRGGCRLKRCAVPREDAGCGAVPVGREGAGWPRRPPARGGTAWPRRRPWADRVGGTAAEAVRGGTLGEEEPEEPGRGARARPGGAGPAAAAAQARPPGVAVPARDRRLSVPGVDLRSPDPGAGRRATPERRSVEPEPELRRVAAGAESPRPSRPDGRLVDEPGPMVEPAARGEQQPAPVAEPRGCRSAVADAEHDGARGRRCLRSRARPGGSRRGARRSRLRAPPSVFARLTSDRDMRALT